MIEVLQDSISYITPTSAGTITSATGGYTLLFLSCLSAGIHALRELLLRKGVGRSPEVSVKFRVDNRVNISIL